MGNQIYSGKEQVVDCHEALWMILKERSEKLCLHLNQIYPTAYPSVPERLAAWIRQIGSDRGNPVRVKNLEKVLAQLQVLQHFLDDPAIIISQKTYDTFSCLLYPLNQPEKISFNMAWEIADKLEGELLRIGHANYIRSVWYTWPRSRITDEIRDQVVKDDEFHTDNENNTLNRVVRPWLIEDQSDQAHEYRRDRAMISLRRSYLNIMAVTLLALDLIFCALYIALQSTPDINVIRANTVTVLMSLFIGAIGSVLARATRLSQQPLSNEARAGKNQEIPLGIRSLMSTWSVFWAQVMTGATAALVVYLVFSSGLLNIENLAEQNSSTLAVLSFIGGFSEPFLLNVVGRISNRVV